MANKLTWTLPDGRSIGEVLLAPLARSELHVIDVGARNHMYDLPEVYASQLNYIGFEPNQEEYDKLIIHDTDAERLGVLIPRWKSEKFYSYALWSDDQSRPFYLTQGTGACTMMGEADRRVASRMFLDPSRTLFGGAVSGEQKSYYEQHVRVLKTDDVCCRRLDQLLDPEVLKIDYLKIDVEGGELEILKGGEALFLGKRVLFIKTEFFFTPHYPNLPLLGAQQEFLGARGFRLLGLDLHHARYTRSPTTILPENDRRLIYGGDAYFALDPDLNSITAEDLHRLGIAAIAHGFTSFGVSVLRDSKLLEADTISAIEKRLSRANLRTWHLRAVHFLEMLPQTVLNALAKLRYKA